MSTPQGPALAVLPATKDEALQGSAQILQPSGWPMPKGYANGMAADGRLVVTGGVIGWDPHGHLAADFVGQVHQTLSNISAILAEGGARPEHLVRLTWYVVDMEEYLANLKTLGQIYRDIFGAHYPGDGAGPGGAPGRAGGAGRDRGDGGGAALKSQVIRNQGRASFLACCCVLIIRRERDNNLTGGEARGSPS